MSFDIDLGLSSTAGRRDRNDDFVASMGVPPNSVSVGFIAAIADGVSSTPQGRMAAQTTAMSLVEDYSGAPPTWDTSVALDRILVAQNAWLHGSNRRNADALALTTLTAVVLRGQSWTVAHVGDTRAHLLRGDDFQPLTQDHATPHLDLRSGLTRAIGLDAALRVDYNQGDLQLHDVLVLTSDGVHGVLPPARIAALAMDGTAQAAAEALVRAALDAGSRDNASAIVLRVRGLDGARLDDALLRTSQLPVPPKLALGQVIDGMVVTSLVADSGVHILYQVREVAGGRLLALKTLHPSRAADAEERAMLAHEAWLAARVDERGGAGFVAAIEPAAPSACYLLYAWHAGQTLEQKAAGWPGRRAPVRDVVAWGASAARALGVLHRLGIIHRDVKPANLHLGDDGELRLLDLGAAASGHEPAEQRDLHAGTPSYMNPEQWSGERVDARTDLYALGVTLYVLLTGRLPYGRVEPYQVGRYQRDPPAPSKLRPDVPIWLDHLVLKAVALDRATRFETAEELLLALERGASRPLPLAGATPLVRRNLAALWKFGLLVSLLFNVLLVYWLLFIPR